MNYLLLSNWPILRIVKSWRFIQTKVTMQFLTSLCITYCGDFNDKMALRSPCEINRQYWDSKIYATPLNISTLNCLSKKRSLNIRIIFQIHWISESIWISEQWPAVKKKWPLCSKCITQLNISGKYYSTKIKQDKLR